MDDQSGAEFVECNSDNEHDGDRLPAERLASFLPTTAAWMTAEDFVGPRAGSEASVSPPVPVLSREWPQPRKAIPRAVKVAIDFLHVNMHKPLSIAEIADAAHVSVRSLQEGFRKAKGTTPIAYLRSIRLEAVHAELAHPDNRLPVGEVAQKWGFTHLGRFAAQYRSVYGVYPSDRLRQIHAF